jgi:hypothetical protein
MNTQDEEYHSMLEGTSIIEEKWSRLRGIENMRVGSGHKV